MNAASRELFRQNLLTQLNTAAPYAMPTATLTVGTVAGGFQVKEPEVLLELTYLADKGLVRESKKLVSPELKRWEITSAGRDYVAEHSLA